jgi:hypothetical protein
MSNFINIESLSQAKEELAGKTDWKDTYYHFGSLQLDQEYKEKETYAILKYVFEEIIPPIKIFKWGDFEKERKREKWSLFNGLKNESPCYHKFLPVGWTEKPRPNHENQIAGMDTVDTNGEYIDLRDHVNEQEYALSKRDLESLNSMYYHSAKAHWLIHSIQEDGLWAPIQGQVIELVKDSRYQLRIHPGSIRSGCFEEMGDPDMELCITDAYDTIDQEPIGFEDFMEYWKTKLSLREDLGQRMGMGGHYNVSFTLIQGALEYNSNLMNVQEFRPKIYNWNKKVHSLSKGKPLNIYIGYDSRHGNLAEVSKISIEQSIFKDTGAGHLINEIRYEPEIKLLDVSKIPEYTREYANQSTEFTYSRFLIPYLENYEGFSIFIDDDFIFERTLLPMFYYLHPDDAVACIQYPQYKHDETKFNGEVNIDYPKKLWSSMMIFNNGHEDCKKLTPETVNTWTGKQLHQFEWTDKISKIPEKYIFVEGYDDPDVKWDFSGIHYTRGGPWVEGMDCDHINNLDIYKRWRVLA